MLQKENFLFLHQLIHLQIEPLTPFAKRLQIKVRTSTDR